MMVPRRGRVTPVAENRGIAMKQLSRRFWMCAVAAAGLWLAPSVRAADDPSLAPLRSAAAAYHEGQEARAWELYLTQSKAFRQQWVNLDSDFVIWVADQHRKQKQFKDAVEISDSALGSRKMTPAATAQLILVKGDTLRDQQNFAAAKLEYESIDRNTELRKTPAGQTARFRIVDVLRQTRDYDAADAIIERLKDIADPVAQAEAYFMSAKIAFDREDYPGARENLIEVKKRVPDHVETVFLEAELNLREDRLQDPELEIGDRVLTTYVVPGRPVTMKMQDRNLAVVRGGGGIPVEIMTRKGKDREIMNLLPSPRDPTLFRGTLNTKLGDAVTNDMRLEVMGDDVVIYQILETFQKENSLKYESKTMAILSDGDLTATAGEFQTTEDRDEALMKQRMSIILERDGKSMAAVERIRDPWLVRPGNPVRIQVIDYDRDISSLADSVSVKVDASSGDVVASVPLKETEPHSGIFRGILKTSKAAPRATASDTAGNSDPNGAITADGAGWRSNPKVESNKWFEVDLMTIHPLAGCELDCNGAGTVKDVSLYGQVSMTPELIASTRPTKEQVYGYVDLARHFGPLKATAAYLYAEVESEADQEAVIKIGSCDGVVAWLNGKEIHAKPNGRNWKPEEDTVKATLKAGRNGIVLKVLQINGPWGASMTVLKPDGTPLASMPVVSPAAPGVVTQWHLFNRPTPEDGIQFGETVSVAKPVRIKDKAFRWVAKDVTPPASLTISNGMVKAVFHRPAAFRRLRWSFDAIEGKDVAIRKATVQNTFGATILPSPLNASQSAANDVLELGPGDKVDITYTDEHRIRRDDNRLHASLKSGFFNAQVMLAYETIEMDEEGKREIVYDPAFRFRAGTTESVVCHITDYDADVSDEMDKVKVFVQTAGGEKIDMEALETEAHSGEFLAILRLGAATAKDTVKVVKGDSITLAYQDEENSDGRLSRSAIITDAPADAPDLLLYQTVVLNNDEGLMDKKQPSVLLRPMPGEGLTADKPVITSMDTSVTFRAIYPGAALSQKSVLTARLLTEREAVEAKTSGAQPAYTDLAMNLVDPTNGEFTVAVDVRVGDPSAYADTDRSQEALGKRTQAQAVFYIKSGDLVRILIPTADGAGGTNGWYRLASDATIKFTDRRYLDKESQIFAGDFTYVKLTDRDMDVSDGLDTASVSVNTKAGTVPVSLTEVLPHSGVFSGRLKTDFAGAAPAEGVLPVQYGETIAAEYSDALCVGGTMPRKVGATVQVYMGDDAQLATFTKRFSDEDIAVKTRLLMAEALFELAKEHRDSGQKDLASAEIAEGKQVLEEAIADYPDTVHAPHAEFLLGNLAQELEKYEEALERYNKVLSNWPDSEFSAKAQLRKGICLEKTGDMDNALDAYVELTYSYPRSTLVSDAIIRLAQHFYKTKEYEVAGKIFGNFQHRNPDHELAAKALFLSAQSYMKGAEERKAVLEGRYDVKAQGWLQDSITKFEKLIATYDDKDLRAESMYWLGDCYVKNTDMKNAYITLKRLTWDYPETKWAKFARGQLVQNEQTFKKFATEQ
jgi:TolA-binding protein